MCEIKTETLLVMLLRRSISMIVRPIRAIVNYILKGTKLMEKVQDVLDRAADIKTLVESYAASISSINLKLDEVKAKFDALVAGAVVSQPQLDEIGAILSDVKGIAESAKSESEAVSLEAGDLAAPVPG